MRVTNQMMVDQSIANMNQASVSLMQLQTRAASEKQFQVASDDPTRAAASLTLHSTIARNDATLASLGVTGELLNENEAALQQMVDLATQAQALAKRGLSDSQGAAERTAQGRQMDALLQSAVAVGNTTKDGNYLFAGFKVDTAPFTYAGGSVTYNVGSTAGPIQHSLGSGQALTVNVDGNKAFKPLFDALTSARDALLANDATALQAALTNLTSAASGVADTRSLNGARAQQVTQVVDRLGQTQTALKGLLSQNDDANMAETLSLLSQQQTVYQATIQVGARAIQSSLFDFLK